MRSVLFACAPHEARGTIPPRARAVRGRIDTARTCADSLIVRRSADRRVNRSDDLVLGRTAPVMSPIRRAARADTDRRLEAQHVTEEQETPDEEAFPWRPCPDRHRRRRHPRGRHLRRAFRQRPDPGGRAGRRRRQRAHHPDHAPVRRGRHQGREGRPGRGAQAQRAGVRRGRRPRRQHRGHPARGRRGPAVLRVRGQEGVHLGVLERAHLRAGRTPRRRRRT